MKIKDKKKKKECIKEALDPLSKCKKMPPGEEKNECVRDYLKKEKKKALAKCEKEKEEEKKEKCIAKVND